MPTVFASLLVRMRHEKQATRLPERDNKVVNVCCKLWLLPRHVRVIKTNWLLRRPKVIMTLNLVSGLYTWKAKSSLTAA